MKDHPIPYITPKEMYKALMFTRHLQTKGLYLHRAVEVASTHYEVDSTQLTEYAQMMERNVEKLEKRRSKKMQTQNTLSLYKTTKSTNKPIYHGTSTAYKNHGCRCEDCRKVSREEKRASEKAKRAKVRPFTYARAERLIGTILNFGISERELSVRIGRSPSYIREFFIHKPKVVRGTTFRALQSVYRELKENAHPALNLQQPVRRDVVEIEPTRLTWFDRVLGFFGLQRAAK
jgi:hypothetical protein